MNYEDIKRWRHNEMRAPADSDIHIPYEGNTMPQSLPQSLPSLTSEETENILFTLGVPETFDRDTILDAYDRLSRLTRFRGNKHALTVAEHSQLLASAIGGLPWIPQCDDDRKLHVLYAYLHDIPEAWTGDIPYPLKKHLTPVLNPIENAIYSRMRAFIPILPPAPPPIVMEMDRHIGLIELSAIDFATYRTNVTLPRGNFGPLHHASNHTDELESLLDWACSCNTPNSK